MSAAASQREHIELGEELALVISSEITVKVLVYLVERVGSPKEIGIKLGIGTSKASHHVKKLERLKLIELIEEKEVGGAIQHFYRAIVRPIVSNEHWGKLSVAERQRYSVWIARMLLTDMSNAFNAGIFDAFPTRHFSRVPMVVDEKGLAEVAEIQNRALNELIQAEVASAERRLQSGDPGMNLIAAMTCFPLPQPSDGLNLREGT